MRTLARAPSTAEFQAKDSDAELVLKRGALPVIKQWLSEWPGFLCIFRVIFHSDNESDGSGIFH